MQNKIGINTMYYQIKTKVIIVDENGNGKKESHTHLVEAVSWTDAEKKVNEHLEGFEFLVKGIVPTKIEYIDQSGGKNYYKCGIALVEFNDKGKETQIKMQCVFQADDIAEAQQKVMEVFKENDIESVSISLYKLTDIF